MFFLHQVAPEAVQTQPGLYPFNQLCAKVLEGCAPPRARDVHFTGAALQSGGARLSSPCVSNITILKTKLLFLQPKADVQPALSYESKTFSLDILLHIMFHFIYFFNSHHTFLFKTNRVATILSLNLKSLNRVGKREWLHPYCIPVCQH